MTYRITVDLAPIGIAYEVGSLPEGLGILVDEKATLINIAAIGNEILNPAITAEPAPNGTEGDKPKGKRGRPSKEEIAARAAAAVAPPPAPVPAAPVNPVPTPVDMTPDPVTGIPAGLKRDGIAPPTFVAPAAPVAAPVVQAPVVAAPPPPTPPAPVPPAAPSELADKVIARLRDLKAVAPDGGAAYAAWLTNPDPTQGYGIAKQGTDFDSVLSILRFKDEPLLQRIASALGVL